MEWEMYTYMKRRREGVVNNLTNELLQPKTEDSLRKALEEASKKGGEQNKVNRREDRARAKQIMANATEQVREQESPKRIRHDLELLDEVIQKGFDTLSKMEVISPATAIKAMEMKHKLTNGSTGGYTYYGLEEIKLREDAREQAITAAILQFIPVEQHDAVIRRMEDVTRAYYESIGLGEAYAQQIAREAMEGRV